MARDLQLISTTQASAQWVLKFPRQAVGVHLQNLDKRVDAFFWHDLDAQGSCKVLYLPRGVARRGELDRLTSVCPVAPPFDRLGAF